MKINATSYVLDARVPIHIGYLQKLRLSSFPIVRGLCRANVEEEGNEKSSLDPNNT